MGPRLKVSSDRLVKPGMEPATPGLQDKWFIHYTTAAPYQIWCVCVANMNGAATAHRFCPPPPTPPQGGPKRSNSIIKSISKILKPNFDVSHR